jgi:hypothetical protein
VWFICHPRVVVSIWVMLVLWSMQLQIQKSFVVSCANFLIMTSAKSVICWGTISLNGESRGGKQWFIQRGKYCIRSRVESGDFVLKHNWLGEDGRDLQNIITSLPICGLQDQKNTCLYCPFYLHIRSTFTLLSLRLLFVVARRGNDRVSLR